MKCLSVLLFTAPLLAQVTLPGGSIPTPIPSPAYVLQQTFTTGMIGFTTSQTARLNVFNLNSVTATVAPTSTPPPNCTVALQFYDNKGGLVSQTTVPNFAPGASTSFDLTRAAVTSETAVRAEIRGVVVINPVATQVESPPTVGFCGVVTTLEIFDAAGSTVAITSDTRPIAAQGFAVLLGTAAPVR